MGRFVAPGYSGGLPVAGPARLFGVAEDAARLERAREPLPEARTPEEPDLERSYLPDSVFLLPADFSWQGLYTRWPTATAADPGKRIVVYSPD